MTPRTWLVTGASSGIGAALAIRLAERGDTVGLIARRGDRLTAILDRCRRSSPASRFWVADLADPDEAERVAIEAWDAFGGLDVLVNNAGMPKRRPVTSVTPDELAEVMRVNFESPVRMATVVLLEMLEREAGTIVNVSSMGGRVGIPDETAYCASKFALAGWSEAAALDLWDTGVAIRLVIPGPIDTEIWDRPDNDPPRYVGPLEPPEIVADGIIAAVDSDRFEHYVPDLKAVVEFKTADVDAYLAGAAELGSEPA